MEMMMSKEKFIMILKEKTGKTEIECDIIKKILEKHGIIGRKNKEKIIADFIKEMSLSKTDADNLYNDCMEIILKNIL